MEMNKELLAKAKETKAPEELLALAKENGVELTEESAKAYFEVIHPKTGELADEELGNVSGGCNANDGRKIVTAGHNCGKWRCVKCGGTARSKIGLCVTCKRIGDCDNCVFCTYEKGLWLCNFGH